MFLWRERIEPSDSSYGVEWAITDRWGGSSLPPFEEFNLAAHVGDREDAVETNRHRLAHELGLRRSALRFMDQQHGCEVALTPGTRDARDSAQEPRHPAAPAVDGLISDRTDEALVVLVADCTPVLLLDRMEGLVAAVHAGRPGMMSGVVTATVDRLCELGANELEAVIGPSVCSRCYEVPDELRQAAAALLPVTAAITWTGTPAIDVASGVVAQLSERSIPVTWLPGCTREHPDLYSYRGEGRTGRFAGVVRMLPPEQVA